MIKRRDILPKIISFYFGTSAIMIVALHLLTVNLYGEAYSSVWDTAYKVILSFVCIAYFRNSEQVQQTFVVRKTDQEKFVEEEELEETEA